MPRVRSRSGGGSTSTSPVVSTTAPATTVGAWLPKPDPRPVIIDTDWWTDVDDVLALRIACAAERKGLIDIRAVTVNTTLARGPGSVDAVLTYEGRPDVPIGKSHTSHVPTGTPPYQTNLYANYPHKVGVASLVTDSVTLMRTVLAGLAEPADIISIGYLNNLADLLASAADGISALTGAQLVAAKVNRLWVMGGAYPSGSENNFNRNATAIAAAVSVCSSWPTPITFSGFEVGNTVYTGGHLHSAYPTDPLALALVDHGSTNGRNSWDPMHMWLACQGDPAVAGYTTVTGTNAVNAGTGANTFTAGAGTHTYVVKSRLDDEYMAELNALLVPSVGAATSATGPQVYRDGAWQAADISRRALGATSTRAPRETVSGLMMHLHADDLADLADASTLTFWEDRTGQLPVRMPPGGAAAQLPTYRAAIGSKACVQFDGTDTLASAFTYIPRDITVLARVRFSTLPTSTQDIVAADSNLLAGNTRQFHLALNASAQPLAVMYQQSNATGKTDTKATALTVNTWQTIAMRYDLTTDLIEASLDGTSSSGTAPGVVTAQGYYLPIHVGGRYYDVWSTEMMVGYLREVRVYRGRLSNGALATAVTEMAA